MGENCTIIEKVVGNNLLFIVMLHVFIEDKEELENILQAITTSPAEAATQCIEPSSAAAKQPTSKRVRSIPKKYAESQLQEMEKLDSDDGKQVSTSRSQIHSNSMDFFNLATDRNHLINLGEPFHKNIMKKLYKYC